MLTLSEHPTSNPAGGRASSRADPEVRRPGQLDRHRRGSARSLEQELPPEGEIRPLRDSRRLSTLTRSIERAHERALWGRAPGVPAPSAAPRAPTDCPRLDFIAESSRPPAFPFSAAGGATSSTPWSSAARSPRMRIARSSRRMPSTGTSGRSSPDPSPAGTSPHAPAPVNPNSTFVVRTATLRTLR